MLSDTSGSRPKQENHIKFICLKGIKLTSLCLRARAFEVMRCSSLCVILFYHLTSVFLNVFSNRGLPRAIIQKLSGLIKIAANRSKNDETHTGMALSTSRLQLFRLDGKLVIIIIIIAIYILLEITSTTCRCI